MPNIRTRITNVAWREASIASSPELEAKRLDVISRYKSGVQRLGARSLHAVAHHAARPLLSVLAAPYEANGMSFIGSGWNSTVVGEGNQVLKIVRRTELMKPEQRMRYIEHLRQMIGHNMLHHPGIAVPSDVAELEHPLSGNPVVAILQPHIEGVDALSAPASNELRAQLQEFAERSLDEMVPNGVAPDIVGLGNVLANEAGIHLVDTVALENLDIPHATFPLSVKKLEHLARRGVSTTNR
jgi:hypothetical protein